MSLVPHDRRSPTPSVPHGATAPTDAAVVQPAGPPALGHGEPRVEANRVHEATVRSNPDLVTAGRCGGTSRAGDTSRLAGYVADQERASAVPTGGAIAKSPEDFAGPESEPGKPPRRPPAGPTPRPAPPSPAPTPTGIDPATPVPLPPAPTPARMPKCGPDPAAPIDAGDQSLRLGPSIDG
jgi:hypothetical protein